MDLEGQWQVEDERLARHQGGALSELAGKEPERCTWMGSPEGRLHQTPCWHTDAQRWLREAYLTPFIWTASPMMGSRLSLALDHVVQSWGWVCSGQSLKQLGRWQSGDHPPCAAAAGRRRDQALACGWQGDCLKLGMHDRRSQGRKKGEQASPGPSHTERFWNRRTPPQDAEGHLSPFLVSPEGPACCVCDKPLGSGHVVLCPLLPTPTSHGANAN